MYIILNLSTLCRKNIKKWIVNIFVLMFLFIKNFFSNRNGGNILKQDHSLLSPVRFLGMKMKNPQLYQKLTTLVSHRKTKMNGFDKDNLKITSEKILEIVSSENDEGMNLIINTYLLVIRVPII